MRNLNLHLSLLRHCWTPEELAQDPTNPPVDAYNTLIHTDT